MQQATVNLMADMGAQPATLQSGPRRLRQSTDTAAPTATITSPAAGASLKNGEVVAIPARAADSGGVVAAVEVSTDGGKTWHPASGTTSWTYAWNVDSATSATLKARAIDDSANIGAASAGREVAVSCPCSMLGSRTPAKADAGDGGSISVGVKFRSDLAGTISGIRYFKSTANTGTHVGALWTQGGTLLAEATFSGGTTSGWQQVQFASPVTIQPNTTYVASYFAPNGHYSDTSWQLNEPPATGPTILDHGPLHILPDVGNGNGLYSYSQSSDFPTHAYQADNYWVDVLFTPKTLPLPPGAPGSVTASAGLGQATVNWSAPSTGGAPASYRITPYIGSSAGTPVTVPATSTSKTLTGLTGGTTYTFVVTAINEAGAGPDSAPSNPVTPTTTNAPGAPTGVAATAAAISAKVTWTAPASDGGSAITGYRVTPYLGGQAQSPVSVGAAATSAKVEGLTAGSSYTFTVTAINAVGPSPESTPSNAVVPTGASVPGAPTAVTAVAKSSGALVTWTAPASDGGSPITGYKVIPFLGATAQAPTSVGAGATSATVTGLTNNSTYTFKVAAVNAAGTGPESAASGAVTPYDTIFDLATPATVDSATAARSSSGSSSAATSPAPSTASASTKPPTNTGTHVGSLWTASGSLLAPGHVQRRDRLGLAAGEIHDPGPDPAEHDLRRRLPGAERPLLGQRPDPRRRRRQRAAPGRSRRLAGGNGVYAYGSGSSFPERQLPGLELLGRRALRAGTAAGRAWDADGGQRQRRARLGDRLLDRAGERRQSDQLRGHALQSRRGADAENGDRDPAGDLDHGQRAHRRQQLHLHRQGGQRRRNQSRVGAFGPGHAERRVGARDARHGDRGGEERRCAGHLDGADERRRQPDHRLHGHPLPRGTTAARPRPTSAAAPPRPRSARSPTAAATPSKSPPTTRSAPAPPRRRATRWCRG